MAVRFVSPSKCKMWTLHVRSEETVNTTSCANLIASMRKHGQRHPALARMRRTSDGCEFELIYGARRLFAAQHLGIDVLIDVREVDDRAAVIAMDIENRPRQDISPYERGVNYGRWLRAGYFNSQQELAKELGVSEARVSRLLKYSELPTVVVAAFDSVRDIREEWAVRLASICRDPKRRDDIVRRARERASATRRVSAQCMYDALLRGAGLDVVKDKGHDEVVRGSSGKPLFRVAFHARTLHLILPRAEIAPATLAEIKQNIAGVLERRSGALEARRTARAVELAVSEEAEAQAAS